MNPKFFKNFLHDSKYFSIRNHAIIVACDVKIALIKLTKPPFCDCWLISSVNFTNMKSFNFFNVSIHGHEPSKRYCQVVSERTLFTSLIIQIIYQFRVFSILPHQYAFKFKNWGVNFNSSVSLENLNNLINYISSDCSLSWMKISSSFWTFQFHSFIFCFCCIFHKKYKLLHGAKQIL